MLHFAARWALASRFGGRHTLIKLPGAGHENIFGKGICDCQLRGKGIIDRKGVFVLEEITPISCWEIIHNFIVFILEDEDDLKKGTSVKEGAIREVNAYVLDHPKSGRHYFSGEKYDFADVHPTFMAKFWHMGFSHRENLDTKIGSLQMFMDNIGIYKDMGPSSLPVGRNVSFEARFDCSCVFVTQSALARCLYTLLIAKDQVKKRSSDLWDEAPYIDVGVLEMDLGRREFELKDFDQEFFIFYGRIGLDSGRIKAVFTPDR
ncbi:hypothetical protein AgCh_024689 [Apium graveolens]